MSQNHKNSPTSTIKKTFIWGGREEGINPKQWGVTSNALFGSTVSKWDCVVFQVEVPLLDYWLNRLVTKLRAKFLKKYFPRHERSRSTVISYLKNWFLPKKKTKNKNQNTTKQATFNTINFILLQNMKAAERYNLNPHVFKLLLLNTLW